MTTPDRRLETHPRTEPKRLQLTQPQRTETNPISNLHKTWLQRIENDWPQLCVKALEELSSREDAVLTVPNTNEADLDERFQFRKSDIRLYIINMGTQSDIRAMFNYFEVGTAVEVEEPRKQHEEEFFDVTRLELLQTYVAIHTLLDMSVRVGKNKRKLRKGVRPKKKNVPSDERTLQMLDRLMRQKPYKGGPLMTVKT